VTRYLTLAAYYWLAEQVTGIEATTLVATSRVELADSALHAAAAEFAGEEFYPDLVDKAAVLVCRLTKNHLLPDGNKRAAWVSLAVFVELNGGQWQPNPPISMSPRPSWSRLQVERSMNWWWRNG
jgi:death-on-curing protein